MESFIKSVAEYYYGKLGNEIDKAIFVFESKRASLFFRHHLSLLSKDKPIFSPEITTVNDFILSLDDSLKTIDSTGLLFEFYKVYIEYISDKKELKLDRFIFWANIILNDFDLIDRYMVDTEQMFSNIENYKNIVDDYTYLSEEQRKAINMVALWTAGNNENFKDSFILFWKMLKPLYDNLNASLKAKGFMYEGGIYRRLAENEDIFSDKFDKGKKIIFVGLFYMGKAQFSILKSLKKYYDVDFCWDENAKILEDESSVASKIINENKNTLGSVDDGKWNLHKYDTHPEITIVGCPGKIAEAKAVNLLIDEMGSPMDNLKEIDSAIILSDENILIPVVSSIPQNIKDINISIGYPLKNSNISLLVNRWVKLLSSVKNKSGEFLFKTSDIISFFTTPIISAYDSGASLVVEEIKNNNNYGKRYIINSEMLSELNASISGKSIVLDILLRSENIYPSGFLTSIIDILTILTEKSLSDDALLSDENKISSFELEFIFHYLTIAKRLKSLTDDNKYMFEDTDIETNINIVVKLFDSIVNSKSIPFEGDPLKGIQIIGLLESRCLDFENLIILSAQDGIVSSDKGYNSIIPSAIKKGFGLPSNEITDAIESYRFYRLVGKAKRIIFSYNQNGESVSGSEPSRFITQMELLYGYGIRKKTLSTNNDIQKDISISITDFDDDICSQMNRFITKGGPNLSASAINTLVRCPICFYYDYIKRLRNDQDPYMILKENEFGDIVHLSLKEILKEYENGKLLDKGVFDGFLDEKHKIRSFVQKAYCNCLSIDARGDYNALDNMYIDMCCEYIKIIFEYERSLSDEYEIYYLFGEKQVHRQIKIGPLALNFSGSIDRMDILKNKKGELFLRIIDYKTGKCELDTKWVNFFDNKNHPKAIFQTLLYSEIVLQYSDEIFKNIDIVKNIQTINICPCIYGTKELSKNKNTANINIFIDNDIILDYKNIRDDFVKRFYDFISVYFTNSEYSFNEDMVKSLECSYCPISIQK